MKTIVLTTIITICMVGVAQAVPTVETDHQVVNEYIWDTFLGSWNSDAVWQHNNPYSGNYEAAVAAGNIVGATLTINASLINPTDNQVATVFTDKDGIDHSLPGYLNNGDTIYALDPIWLDGTQVTASIDWTRSFRFDLGDDAYINYSNLTVTSNPAIPAPGAILLGSIGVGLVGWLRRRGTL